VLVKLQNAVGTLEVNWLPFNINVFSLVNFPICEGKDPLRLLESSCRLVIPTSPPKVVGMVPPPKAKELIDKDEMRALLQVV